MRELIAHKSPKSVVSESLKAIRTNLLFSAVDEKLKTVLITSANSVEGKSFISANLAITFSQNNQKVLIVDCDLRRGRIHEIFQINNDIGLSNLLLENDKIIKKYIKQTEIEHLDVLTMGVTPPNPSELLGSKKFTNFLEKAKKDYDLVIIDSPPVNSVSDALNIANQVNAILLVAAHSKTKNNDLDQAIKHINNVGGKIAGIVINQKKINKKSYYGKYYKY